MNFQLEKISDRKLFDYTACQFVTTQILPPLYAQHRICTISHPISPPNAHDGLYLHPIQEKKSHLFTIQNVNES